MFCNQMQKFSYFDKREVLQQEYSQPPILPSPHFLWVVKLRKPIFDWPLTFRAEMEEQLEKVRAEVESLQKDEQSRLDEEKEAILSKIQREVRQRFTAFSLFCRLSL